MDKPPTGINPKSAGTQNGSQPKTKGGKPMPQPGMGWSLPKSPITKVPGQPGSVQGIS
jgi:hypothetical protein